MPKCLLSMSPDELFDFLQEVPPEAEGQSYAAAEPLFGLSLADYVGKAEWFQIVQKFVPILQAAQLAGQAIEPAWLFQAFNGILASIAAPPTPVVKPS